MSPIVNTHYVRGVVRGHTNQRLHDQSMPISPFPFLLPFPLGMVNSPNPRPIVPGSVADVIHVYVYWREFDPKIAGDGHNESTKWATSDCLGASGYGNWTRPGASCGRAVQVPGFQRRVPRHCRWTMTGSHCTNRHVVWLTWSTDLDPPLCYVFLAIRTSASVAYHRKMSKSEPYL